MTKLLVIPNNNNIDDILDKVDGILFGIKGYSVNTYNIDIKDLEIINSKIKEKNKELFISLNKNMTNDDIEALKEILLLIDKLNIKGIFYADTCFINLKKELNIKTDLVWSNEHLTTNYATINFWHNYGVNYTYLAAEITKKEIIEIKENTPVKLIVPIFGYLPMYVSFRHNVKNYLKTFKIESNPKTYYIEKEGNIYPIVDDELGTVVYSSKPLDGYEEYKEIGVDYVTLNEFNIPKETFIKVIDRYKGETKKYDLESDKGFLYQTTIYKVKK